METKKERFDVILGQSDTQIRQREKTEKKSQDVWYYFGLVGQIGFTIALPIAAGGIVGVAIDRWFATTPAATLLLLFVGVGISFLGLFTVIKEVGKKRIY